MNAVDYSHTALPPELSALEASLASLEPSVVPGCREETKSVVLMRLFRRGAAAPQLSGGKLIETIVRNGDREITLSLREYIRSARLVAGLCGAVIGLFGGVLLGLLLGIGTTPLLTKSQPIPQPVREVYHVPYFIDSPVPPTTEPRP